MSEASTRIAIVDGEKVGAEGLRCGGFEVIASVNLAVAIWNVRDTVPL